LAKTNDILREVELHGTDSLKYIVYKPKEGIHDILNEGLKKDDQIWTRPTFPDFSKLTKAECQALYIREIRRIRFGVYCWIGGDLEYISGKHYFGLTHWLLKDSSSEYLIYTQTHRDFFYFLEICDKDSKCAGAIVFSMKRFGKALDVKTVIPTPSGFKTMGELQVGDFIFGGDGFPTKIINVTPYQYNRPCYRIEFCDSTQIIADENHLWVASDAKDRYTNVPSNEFNKFDFVQARVVTTKQMFDSQKSNQGNNNWSIKNAKPVEYDKKELKIPPYIFGLWLGDGSSYTTKLTNIDQEIIDDWIEYGKSIGLETIKDGDVTYALTSGRSQKDRSNKGRNQMLAYLQEYNVLKNKHIPKDYLESSVEDRIELLRGIMDTDGSKQKGNNLCEVCMKKESFRDEVYMLICSLGIKARKFAKHNKKYDKTYYYINFSTYDINPFRLTRKANGMRKKEDRKGGIVNEFRYIKRIVSIHSVPVKCIEVDNESKTYLCTKSHVVTHNSELSQIEMYGEGLLSDSGVFIVQALSDAEAADIFSKTHYANENLHNTLPIWKYITSKKEEPEKNLVAFKRDSTIDSITWKSADGSSSSSAVSFMVKPTKLSGIQGKKLKRGFLDEFASLKPVKDMTLANYHAKAIAQCTEDFGSIVVGKTWLIATAENLESEALVDAKEIWDNSAEDRKDANGYNISMMKRMFIPYYIGARGSEFMDKFGRPKIEEAKAWYANKLASMSEGAKIIFRRQNPETISDVFEIEHTGGLEIDVIEIIKQRKRELLLQRKAQPLYDISKYNSQILLSPASKEGQFTLEMFEHPEEHHLYRVGIDATSTAINSTNKAANGGEKGKEKSKFAIVVHKITGDNQYVDVANLWVRPEKRHLIEKAGLWLCQYYNKYGGCRAYPERNASAGSTLTDLFEAEGEQRILIRQLKKHNTDKLMEKSTDAYGIYIDGNNKDYRTSIMNKYLRLHGHKINSIRLIDNLLAYGLENADLADAYGVGTMACGNFDAEVKQEKKQVQKVYYENVLTGSGRFQRVKRVINVQEK
jgi:hypothetical protein